MDNNGKQHEPHAQIVLDFNPITFELQMSGQFPNYDVALAMLAQATRACETHLRLANAAALQQQLRDQAEAERIAKSLRH